MIDHREMQVASLSPHDRRSLTANVAGPAALLVAKLHKIAERRANPTRLLDKDAHDSYRILVAISTDELADSLLRLLDDKMARTVTAQALTYLRELFADGPNALGSHMAARTEQGLGDPDTAAQASAVLAADLHAAVNRRRPGHTPTE